MTLMIVCMDAEHIIVKCAIDWQQGAYAGEKGAFLMMREGPGRGPSIIDERRKCGNVIGKRSDDAAPGGSDDGAAQGSVGC